MTTHANLYRLTEAGALTVRTYTNADAEISYDAGEGVEVYEPTAISRTEFVSKNDLRRSNLEVTLPLTHPAAIAWMADSGELLVSLTIFERDEAGTYSVAWKGRLAGVLPGVTNVVLNFESLFTSLRRSGLRARYQRSCRHALYGRGCNLDPEDFAYPGTLTALVGRVATVTEAGAQADGFFIGGMFRDPTGALAYIVDHVGTSLTLQRITATLAQAAEDAPVGVTLYPGCDHTLATCWDKFNNGLNFGGYKWLPSKNPMGGSSIV